MPLEASGEVLQLWEVFSKGLSKGFAAVVWIVPAGLFRQGTEVAP